MKKAILGLILTFTFFSGRAQVNLYGTLDDVYRNFMVNAHTQFTKAILNDFIGVGGNERFMSNNWVSGGATNYYGVTISQNYLFNYDFLGHELHAKWRDTTIVVNTNYVKHFFLIENNRTHNYIKSAALDPQAKFFYESIAYDEVSGDSGKVQLLKHRIVKQLKANKNDYLANFSGDYTDKFNNKVEYYIVFPDNTSTKVKMSKSSIAEALSVKYKDQVNIFFKQPTGSFNEDVAASLIRSINQ